MNIFYFSDFHIDDKLKSLSILFNNNVFEEEQEILKISFDEFKAFTKKSDIIISVGDFSNFDKLKKDNFIKLFCEHFSDKIILYVMGNHEYYSNISTVEEINEYFKNLEKEIPNFNLLKNSSVTINDVDFFGGCLWGNLTDIEKFKESFNPDKFKSSDIIEFIKKDQEEFLINYNDWIKTNPKNLKIALSHVPPHSEINNEPVKREIKREHMEDKRGVFFNTELDYLFNAERVPNYWIYGHNHYNKNYKINGCNILSNQYGEFTDRIDKSIRKNIIV